MAETVAYKIIDAAEWREAVAEGAYAGSAVDLADGYIHLSTAGPAGRDGAQTLRRARRT